MFFPAPGTISGRLDRQGHFGTYPYFEDPTETFHIVQRKLDAKREVQIKLLV